MDENTNANGNTPTPSEEAGEGVGGITGVLAGAAIGSAAGPIGTIIGGIAGAVGGWWAGRAIADASSHFTHGDDSYYRDRYEGSPQRLADRSYNDVRPAYQLGHLAGANPDYAGRDFESIEHELLFGWNADVGPRYGSWEVMRGYARDAYDRSALIARESVSAREASNEAQNSRVNLSDPTADRLDQGPAEPIRSDASRAAERAEVERANDAANDDDARLDEAGNVKYY